MFAPVGCPIVAPVDGVVDEVSTVDRWTSTTNLGADRGGLSFSIVGVDGVRYYGSHLSVLNASIRPGVHVRAGQSIGKVGRSGDARGGPSHMHFGISWPTPHGWWWVRRGELYPWPYLDAWRAGTMRSPAAAVRGPAPQGRRPRLHRRLLTGPDRPHQYHPEHGQHPADDGERSRALPQPQPRRGSPRRPGPGTATPSPRAIEVLATAYVQVRKPSAEGTTPRYTADRVAPAPAVGACASSQGAAGSSSAIPVHVVQAVAATAPSDSASGLTTTWNAPWHSAAASTTSRGRSAAHPERDRDQARRRRTRRPSPASAGPPARAGGRRRPGR